MWLLSATKTEKKKKGGRGEEEKPFHAHPHPVKQVMHSNMAAGLGILRAVFFINSTAPFLLCIFCTAALAMEGVTSPCSCYATLSCFRDLLEKTPCCKPLIFSIFYFCLFFLSPAMYLRVTPKECICTAVVQQMSLWSDLTGTKHCATVSTQLPLL